MLFTRRAVGCLIDAWMDVGPRHVDGSCLGNENVQHINYHIRTRGMNQQVVFWFFWQSYEGVSVVVLILY